MVTIYGHLILSGNLYFGAVLTLIIRNTIFNINEALMINCVLNCKMYVIEFFHSYRKEIMYPIINKYS